MNEQKGNEIRDVLVDFLVHLKCNNKDKSVVSFGEADVDIFIEKIETSENFFKKQLKENDSRTIEEAQTELNASLDKYTSDGNEDVWVEIKDEKTVPQNKWMLLFNGYWIGVGQYDRASVDIYGDKEFPEWYDETREWIEPIPTHYMPLPKPPVPYLK